MSLTDCLDSCGLAHSQDIDAQVPSSCLLSVVFTEAQQELLTGTVAYPLRSALRPCWCYASHSYFCSFQHRGSWVSYNQLASLFAQATRETLYHDYSLLLTCAHTVGLIRNSTFSPPSSSPQIWPEEKWSCMATMWPEGKEDLGKAWDKGLLRSMPTLPVVSSLQTISSMSGVCLRAQEAFRQVDYVFMPVVVNVQVGFSAFLQGILESQWRLIQIHPFTFLKVGLKRFYFKIQVGFSNVKEVKDQLGDVF